MKKRDKKLLHFTLQTIQRIEYHVHGQSYRAFLRDHMRQDAVIFRLEILGYALRDLHKILRQKRLREYIAHIAETCKEIRRDYRNINTLKIWETITVGLPRLKTVLSDFQAQ